MAFHFFSSGSAWERAFSEALRFLDRPAGTLVLGPRLGEAGRAWIEHHFLSARSVRFGSRIQPWKDWVKAKARDRALAEGKGFRPLNRAGKREHLRVVCRALVKDERFRHLQGIWSEERFFDGFLDCLLEAREAGLTDLSAIERVREQLAQDKDAVYRDAYDDFWSALIAFESLLALEGEVQLDESSLYRLAATRVVAGEDLFLLGFDELPLLATDLLQRWALRAEVFLPLPIPREKIESAMRETAQEVDLPAELALRGLLTGYTGRCEIGRAHV